MFQALTTVYANVQLCEHIFHTQEWLTMWSDFSSSFTGEVVKNIIKSIGGGMTLRNQTVEQPKVRDKEIFK